MNTLVIEFINKLIDDIHNRNPELSEVRTKQFNELEEKLNSN